MVSIKRNGHKVIKFSPDANFYPLFVFEIFAISIVKLKMNLFSVNVPHENLWEY